MKTTDGMLALIIARDAQARLSEAELGDQAEIAKELNDKQSKIRDVKKALRKALSQGGPSGRQFTVQEMLQVRDLAAEAGLLDAIGGDLEAMYKQSVSFKNGEAQDLDGAKARIESGQGIGEGRFIDESNEEAYKTEIGILDAIREGLKEELENVQGQASGQELELQMASQEFSRASQLASNLLNVRNEVLKSFVQAIRA